MFDYEDVSSNSNSADVDGHVMADSHTRAFRHLFIVPEAVDVPFNILSIGKLSLSKVRLGMRLTSEPLSSNTSICVVPSIVALTRREGHA